MCRIGQACNHVAALLIEHHDELPTKTSKTSQPMKWNQPSKKTISPSCANNMVFVKPSHGQMEGNACTPRSLFDPCPTCHGIFNKEAVEKLLCQIEKLFPVQVLVNFGDLVLLAQMPHLQHCGIVKNLLLMKNSLFLQLHSAQYLDKMKLDIDDVKK